jgi:hypothetical protein|tara:strand:+ start:460 stop:1338 length:879 start_codon:yes stop_codon:yes gene_type:complete
MSEEVRQKEEQPNPYNQKKSWHTQEDKPFVSANDTLFFEQPQNKLYDSNDITQAENVNTEELESKKEELTPYKKPDYKKRYDDLKRHYDAKLEEFKTKEQELRSQAQANYVPPKSVEELEKFKQEHPDFYAVAETVAHLQSDEKTKILEDKIAELQGNEIKLRKGEAERRLRERHPDFDDIRNSDDFHSWAKEQPQSIQDWIYNNAEDADLASRALDLFKKDLGIEAPTASKANSPSINSAADMVSTKTTTVEPRQEKVWTEKEIASLSMDEFDKYESEISEAMQQGRIIRD